MFIAHRVYDQHEPPRGRRFLVDRLWPRGIRKEDLKLDAWLKDVAPSTELRQWFSHDAAKWAEFRRRYFVELDEASDAWRPLIEAARMGDVILLYSAHDTEHNNAVALQQYLEKKDTRPHGAGSPGTKRHTPLPAAARSHEP
jgi:uncharacterized protein YeaO (DUF488 family)